MNLMLLKYCLTFVLKKREKRWHAKEALPKKERKDGMPKKHDPSK